MPGLDSRQRAHIPTSLTTSQPPKSGHCPSNDPTQRCRTRNCRTARTSTPQKLNTGSARVTRTQKESTPFSETHPSPSLFCSRSLCYTSTKGKGPLPGGP